MRTVHKFTLLTSHWCESKQVPKGAKFCGFDFQHNNPTLWFEIDTDAPIETRHFEIVGTGNEVPDDGVHLASVQVLEEQPGRYWVWHLYEVTK